MNDKEAIKRLKEVIEDCTSGEDEPYKEASGMAILALEKQIPKRPHADNNGNYAEYFESWLECPKCGEAIPEYTAENNTWCYCLGCGQKLDWEEE